MKSYNYETILSIIYSDEFLKSLPERTHFIITAGSDNVGKTIKQLLSEQEQQVRNGLENILISLNCLESVTKLAAYYEYFFDESFDGSLDLVFKPQYGRNAVVQYDVENDTFMITAFGKKITESKISNVIREIYSLPSDKGYEINFVCSMFYSDAKNAMNKMISDFRLTGIFTTPDYFFETVESFINDKQSHLYGD